jgi:calcineurin-like phosphoesterase family protein
MGTFFTADTHLSHNNIIKYCKRPFENVKEMDEAIIENWNSVVDPKDTVYHLGDFAFAKDVETVEKYIKALNGKIHLVLGNHDKHSVKGASGFIWKRDYARIKIHDQKIILSHYAFRVWDCKHYGSYHLYGHSHGMLPDDESSYSFDVGVDANDFIPISFDQVVERMKTKKVTDLI